MLHSLSDNYVIIYQKRLLFLGVLSIVILSFGTIVERNINYLIITLVTVLFFIIIFALYLKLYNIRYNEEFFFIKNIIYERKIETSKFIKIQHVKFIPYVFAIHFKNNKYYFLENSHEHIFKIFISTLSFENELNQKVKKHIAKSTTDKN